MVYYGPLHVGNALKVCKTNLSVKILIKDERKMDVPVTIQEEQMYLVPDAEKIITNELADQLLELPSSVYF